MSTKPEAFPWWRKGEFDEDKFAADLAERLPDLYARLGYVDFQVVKDTMVVDRARGKALLDITMSEGKQYRVGTFDVIGNRHFSTEEINRFYPFGPNPATLTERADRCVAGPQTGASGHLRPAEVGRRDDQAPHRVQQRRLHLRVRPPRDRACRRAQTRSRGSTCGGRSKSEIPPPSIASRSPATTTRPRGASANALVIIPGDVFSQDRLIRSYQNLGNLGLLRHPDSAARYATHQRLRWRRRPHLPRQGEAHRQHQLRRVDGSGHRHRRVHRVRPAQSVRRVQEGIDSVAVSAATSTTCRSPTPTRQSSSRSSPERSPPTTRSRAISSATWDRAPISADPCSWAGQSAGRSTHDSSRPTHWSRSATAAIRRHYWVASRIPATDASARRSASPCSGTREWGCRSRSEAPWKRSPPT